jgi:hypothetical protein
MINKSSWKFTSVIFKFKSDDYVCSEPFYHNCMYIRLCVSVCDFFSQFCDVVEVMIIHKPISQIWLLTKYERRDWNIVIIELKCWCVSSSLDLQVSQFPSHIKLPVCHSAMWMKTDPYPSCIWMNSHLWNRLWM